MVKDGLSNSDASMFRAQLIWISGPTRDPMIRMLLAVKGGDGSVYEGTASWSKCRAWLSGFLGAPAPNPTLDKLKQFLVRDKYATLSNLIIRRDDLDLYGLQRVDE